MRRKSLTVLIAAAILVALWGAGALAAEKSKGKGAAAGEKSTVTGTVVAAAKDAKGNVTAVAIQTDKGPISVARADKGRDLLKMLNKKVEATGTMKETEGKKTMRVSEVREVK
jgi:hypothetical protein